MLEEIKDARVTTLKKEMSPDELAETEFAGMSIKEDMHEHGRKIPGGKMRVDEKMGYSSRLPPIDIIRPASKSHAGTAASMTYNPTDSERGYMRIFPTDSDFQQEEARRSQREVFRQEDEQAIAAARAARAGPSGRKRRT